MGAFEFIKKQFIDIIQWTEPDDELLVWRFPTADLEIQHGAQLIVRETQAALFVHGGERQPAPTSPLPLLVMNVIGVPQPVELLPWKGQLPTPMGSVHSVVCGGTWGGLATASAEAVIGRLWTPSTRRNDVDTCELNWQRTAFTTVPSTDGVKPLFQTPSTMLPFAALPEFKLRLIMLPNTGLCCGLS